MIDSCDIAVIGAGPAGMAAARTAAGSGCKVVLLDDQPMPGGQIWRNVEAVAARGGLAPFGTDYAKGVAAVADFRAAAVDYRPEARVFGVEAREDGQGGDVLYLADGAAKRLACRRLIVAVGAQERPTPFAGWTLPGVMTLGAGQIALKAADAVPATPLVLAGQGPLLLLFAAQLTAVGATPDLILRLDDPACRGRAVGHGLKAAAFGPDYLAKGARWQKALADAVANVTALSAEGDGRLERVRWRQADGSEGAADAAALLVHDGVIPNAQLTRSMRLAHDYDAAAAAWRPAANPASGLTSGADWVHVAGDCAGIQGWAAADAMGAQAGAAAARALGGRAGVPLSTRFALARARAVRPLLNALYPPARAFRQPADDVLLCRCEEVSAGEVRKAASLGAQGPNQLKAFTRAGMGPCQGRMCALTVAATLAEAQGRTATDVGLMRVRMPISPVSVQEMAALDDPDVHLPST